MPFVVKFFRKLFSKWLIFTTKETNGGFYITEEFRLPKFQVIVDYIDDLSELRES
jgi:hypothetical protein